MELRRGLRAVVCVVVLALPIAATAGPARAAGPSLESQLRQIAGDVKDSATQVAKIAQKKALSAKKKVKRAANTVKNLYKGLTNEPPTSTTTPGTVLVPAASVASLGTYQVDERTFAFVDQSRATEPTKQIPSKPQRDLPTIVWSPKDAPPGLTFPLVVFGHGLGANAGRYRELLKAIASAGYIVAAPTFPVSSKLNTEALTFFDVIGVGSDVFVSESGQPKDLSFVIDQVMALGSADGPFAARIDSSRIAAAGHSLGAITVLDQGYNDCCIDKRLRAVVSIAGAENISRSTPFFTKTPIPLLLIHGDADGTVPYLASQFAYQGAGSPKALLTIRNGEHSFVLKGKPDSLQLIGGLDIQAMVDWFDRYVKDAPDGLTRLDALVASQPQILQLESALG